MTSSSPAPAGDGDTRSWFYYYKWSVGGEVYVPVKRPFFEGVVIGDFLWFALDGVVVGGAEITRIEVEESQGKQEIWYSGDKVLELGVGCVVPKGTSTGHLPDEVVKEWRVKTTKSLA